MVFVEDYNEVLERVEQKMKTLQVGSDEYTQACECYTRLIELKMKQEKQDVDISNQELKMKEDREFRENQQKKEFMEICFKYGTTIFGTVASMGFGYKLIKMFLYFEEEGTLRTFVGRTGSSKIIQSALSWLFKK